MVNASEPGSSASPSGDGSGGSWTDEADRFAARERVRAAVGSRRRERWRRDRAAEDATIPSALRGAVGEHARVLLSSGGSASGRVVAVGADHVALHSPRRAQRSRPAATAWAPFDAIEAVEVAAPVATDSGSAGATLAEVLEELRGEELPVVVTLRSGRVVTGAVVAVGECVSVRPEGAGTVVLVAAAAIALVAR